jgi:sec-independent protein translocase protein TatB
MLNLDPAKLLVIAVVAIILLGPDRLPQVARQVGAAWRSFNEFRHRMESEVRNTMPDLPSSSEIARLARSPSALLNHLSSMSDESPSTNGEGEPSTNGDGDGDASSNAASTNGDGYGHDVGAVSASDVDVDGATDTEPATGEPAQPASATPAEPPPPAESATHDGTLSGPVAGNGSTPRLVPSDQGVVAPGDPTLN